MSCNEGSFHMVDTTDTGELAYRVPRMTHSLGMLWDRAKVRGVTRSLSCAHDTSVVAPTSPQMTTTIVAEGLIHHR